MNLNLISISNKLFNKLIYYRDKYFFKFYIARKPNRLQKKYNISNNFLTYKDIIKNVSEIFISEKNKTDLLYRLTYFNRDSIDETIINANQICKRNIKIFGKKYYLGENINWNEDKYSGYKWPLDYYRDIEIINLNNFADIKIPWEISRLHHLVILGKAFWITNRKIFLTEIIKQFNSWEQNNPYGRGPNWNCTMEVSIRLINLIWTYFFIQSSTKVNDEFHKKYIQLLILHGEHICKNLENKGFVNGNHYISNLVALIYVTNILPFFKNSKKWMKFAIKELKKEMESQVNKDGLHFEDSISYHRLVSELFLHASYILVKTNKNNNRNINYKKITKEIMGSNYTLKLEKMFIFLKSIKKPNGEYPQIGDNDCGRVLYLGEYQKNFNVHDDVLAFAAEFFRNKEIKQFNKKEYEDVLWYFQDIKINTNEAIIKSKSYGYLDSGIYVMRNKHSYLILRCAMIGAKGKGAHTHNDNLSFELCCKNKCYIIDPGTYTYSGDPEMRNKFRSTLFHNTLVIDQIEQNIIPKNDLFRLIGNCDVKVIKWFSNKKKDIFQGKITYYFPLDKQIKHFRKIIFYKEFDKWTIEDEIFGEGRHKIKWLFNLDFGVKIHKQKNGIVLTHKDNSNLYINVVNNDVSNLKILDSWYSPSYGHKMKIKRIEISDFKSLPYKNHLEIVSNWS